MAEGSDADSIPRILVVDRDEGFAARLREGLAGDGGRHAKVALASNPADAVLHLRNAGADVVLADLATLDTHEKGFEFALRRLANLSGGALLVALSRADSVSSSMSALQSGAHDYLVKPFAVETLGARLAELGQRHRKAGAIRLAQPAEEIVAEFHGLVGASLQMQTIIAQIEGAAAVEVPVFVTGERGTGKSAVARAIHAASGRADWPFIEVDCEQLGTVRAEAHIFGDRRSEGAIAAADGGVLHLRHVDALDGGTQLRLLRFLQTATPDVMRDGRSANVRLICSTSANLLQRIEEKAFREDLFYRLHVLTLHLPPLRQRPADILPLARFFLKGASQDQPRLAPAVADALVARDWPGNVSELRLMMALIASQTDGGDFSAEGMAGIGMPLMSYSGPLRPEREAAPRLVEPMWVQERRIIEGAVARFEGNIAQAAAALEISPSTIYRKRQQWDELERHKGAA
ncbi:MAG: sigma-54-dependent Fis family transcriptional regulator [Hyphomicrobiaceae bacterium]|nr:sigma-54-dependent Fis family transcriptional regulator [Hyphomicrobiaceae bacterium]